MLRRRLHLVRKRGELLAHIQNTQAQYNLPALDRRLAYAANREEVAEHVPDPRVRTSIEVDLAIIDLYDGVITDLELTIVREAKPHDGDAFHRPASAHALALRLSGARASIGVGCHVIDVAPDLETKIAERGKTRPTISLTGGASVHEHHRMTKICVLDVGRADRC